MLASCRFLVCLGMIMILIQKKKPGNRIEINSQIDLQRVSRFILQINFFKDENHSYPFYGFKGHLDEMNSLNVRKSKNEKKENQRNWKNSIAIKFHTLIMFIP